MRDGFVYGEPVVRIKVNDVVGDKVSLTVYLTGENILHEYDISMPIGAKVNFWNKMPRDLKPVMPEGVDVIYHNRQLWKEINGVVEGAWNE